MNKERVNRDLITAEDIAAVLNDIYKNEEDYEIIFDIMIKDLEKDVKDYLSDLLS